MLLLLTTAFVLSGAAGLIYESIWSRYLSLFVGHSAYAQIIVLVIFLGGMSVGALLVGNRSERLRHPLLWYTVVEALAGVIGFLFDGIYRTAAGLAYDHLFPALGGGASVIVTKWALAALLIVPQSVLLGATFPLMSAGAIRSSPARSGHILGLLYFANSIGAAIGVLLAGFVLIARVGLPGTLSTAATLNIVVAVAVASAWAAGRYAPAGQRDGARIGSGQEPLAAATASGGPTPSVARALLVLSFGTAIASFIYEIAWIRMLSLVLGSATHSFELMLSAFILGLALGAYWIRRRADALGDPVGLLGMVQWIMGTLAIATLPVYIASFRWMAALLDTFNKSDAGYRGFVIARYVLCLLVMLPATFCAGMTLPLITNILMRTRGRAGGERAIGAVYGVNTLGSIAGVLLAGLVLMPLLGLKLLLISGALVDIGLGLMLLVVRGAVAGRERARVGALAVATACFVFLTAAYIPFDHELLSSGVYRYAVVPRPGEYTVPFYKDGRTATVSIRRTRGGFITLSTNGKPDASMSAFWRDTAARGEPQALTEDIATQLLLPIITLAHAPHAGEVAVIGQGSGMTSHVLLGSPDVRRLVTIEIEPEMIHASRAFYPANRRVFEDPRARFVLDDAKSYFAASGRKFDLILSEPSNPWVSGVSGLFTKEFYSHVRRQLAPDGVFGQWLHFYELDDRLAASVLAALDQSFPSYEVFFTSNADILVVASARPELPAPEWNVVRYPGIARDLQRTLPLTPEVLEATRLGGRALLHPYLAATATPNSDFTPVLDLGAERTRYLKETAEGFQGLGDSRFDISAALAGRRRGFGQAVVPATPEISRVSALALGARLRAVRARPRAARDTFGVRTRDEDLLKELTRLDALDRDLATGVPPTDWRLWLDGVRQAERALEGGTAGVADEAFYDRLRGYLRRTEAPAPVGAAVAVLHGLASWDFGEASRAGQVLVDARQRDSTDWLPVSLTRDGLVVARLRLGDYAGARAAFKVYARDADESPFTARLLAAYLLDAEKRARGARARAEE